MLCVHHDDDFGAYEKEQNIHLDCNNCNQSDYLSGMHRLTVRQFHFTSILLTSLSQSIYLYVVFLFDLMRIWFYNNYIPLDEFNF